ncbi:hypothetical protein G8A07_08350 [Roseateles sp. DAIF2]|uniref:hypothetical protein n=1 Tax=Roseateles sp. DAIF2 TaxID=2714952 RepID=UPI0018A2D499|nr:hypothetical protein [Roseateles sp. DAIF2]QPF72939.1 hypothetical protein G8A07_08350 [Roseateles sp. DAIF2]
MPASELWSWLALAGFGALHGLHPASGWLPAAWALRDGRPLRTLLPLLLALTAGHLTALLLLGLALARGLLANGLALQLGAGALWLGLLLLHRCRRQRAPSPAGPLALWAFIGSAGHGAGLMLVPALAPLCLPGRAFDGTALLPALAAVGVHGAAMLLVSGALAAGAGRLGAALLRGRRQPSA